MLGTERVLQGDPADRQREVPANRPDLLARARAAKLDTLADREGLAAQAESSLAGKRCMVYLAETAVEARHYIRGLVEKSAGVMVSPSRTLQEIAVVPELLMAGMEVVESSPAGMVRHRPSPWAGTAGSPGCHGEDSRQVLAGFPFCLTGASMVTADTGSVVMLEDTGNLRGAASLAYTHVVVVGLDKILPDLETAFLWARAASVCRAGTDICTYLSINTGPSQTGDIESRMVYGMHGPKEVHVVLLDNGRRRMAAHSCGEAMLCVDCGRCLEVCPAYRRLGNGYGGGVYPGGIGVVKTFFSAGVEAARLAGLEDCHGCGECRAACPLAIDIPGMMARLKDAGAGPAVQALSEEGKGSGEVAQGNP